MMAADVPLQVYGGVDTHKDVHVAAVTDHAGRVLGTASFPVTPDGYAGLLDWLNGHGELARAGVEGTGSYGAGLARYLAARGVRVLEVNRPDRQRRRRHGKSDPVDAVAAAMTALRDDGDAGTPKAQDGPAGALGALRAARRGAVKARTQAMNQLKALIITAPDQVRARLGGQRRKPLAAACAALAGQDAPGPDAGTVTALASIGRRWLDLDAETARLEDAMTPLVTAAAPGLPEDTLGAGPQSAAALVITAGDNPGRVRRESGFAAMCGVSPVDCSSGKQQRHRLNRGGDRQADSALRRITQSRLQHDPRTQAYLDKRTAEGKTRKEAVRCLKRYIARQYWKAHIRPAITTTG
jgi:transposase